MESHLPQQRNYWPALSNLCPVSLKYNRLVENNKETYHGSWANKNKRIHLFVIFLYKINNINSVSVQFRFSSNVNRSLRTFSICHFVQGELIKTQGISGKKPQNRTTADTSIIEKNIWIHLARPSGKISRF